MPSSAQGFAPGGLRAEPPADLRDQGARLLQLGLGWNATGSGELMTPSAIARRAQRFGPFMLEEEIGAGGMAVVYRARPEHRRRPVALKVSWTRHPVANDCFRTEARMATRLSHPNIVPVYAIGKLGDRYYLCLQLICGLTLARQTGRFLRRPQAAVRVLAKVARAVQHAHDHGVVHRDLKPSNILTDQRDEPHLIDFGLARLMRPLAGGRTTLMRMGTPGYVSPEQAHGRRDSVSPAADVYSLGAILQKLLTGHAPAPADAARPCREPLHPVNPKLKCIWGRCLETNPAHRYPSAATVAEQLEQWLREGR